MKRYVLLFAVLVSVAGCSGFLEETRLPATLPLPSVDRPMESAEFWIGRLAEPDTILMSAAEIAQFNERNARPDIYITDVLDYPDTLAGGQVRDIITPLIDWAHSRARFGHDNFPLPAEFFTDIEANVDLASLPKTVPVRLGMTTKAADLRVLPTAEIGMEEKGDYEFDILQASLLSPGTPVAVVWATTDRRWVFVVGPYASGWVASDAVGIARSQERVKEYLTAKPFIVVTAPEADAFSDNAMTGHAVTLRLGCRAPLVGKTDEGYRILVPGREHNGTLIFYQAYVPADGRVHEGYPAYCARNIITVAFGMAGRRYGWGGMYGYWDCSSYVRDVFSVFGIMLPRNSTSQGEVGVPLGRFEKDAAFADKYAVLDGATPGTCLLVLPGHVMIYAGEFEGRYYAIHDLWAYRTRDEIGRKKLFGVGRVAVSGLSLGTGGKRGPLIERITDIVEIR
jgi:cell wall-associated NlpC family hydrolase